MTAKEKRNLVSATLSILGEDFLEARRFKIDDKKSILVIDNETAKLLETIRFRSFDEDGFNQDYGDEFASLVDELITRGMNRT